MKIVKYQDSEVFSNNVSVRQWVCGSVVGPWVQWVDESAEEQRPALTFHPTRLPRLSHWRHR